MYIQSNENQFTGLCWLLRCESMCPIEPCSDTGAEAKSPANGAAQEPLVWDGAGAARRLNVSIQLIRKLVRAKRLKRVPGVRKLLIPENSLREFAATAE